MLSSRRKPSWLLALALLLLVLACAPFVAWRPLLRPALYSRVGEEEAQELIKGAAAYLYTRLTQPTPDLAPLTPIRHSGVCPFGVNTFLEQEVEPAKVAQSLDLIRAAGFCFVRQEFPWEDIEISAKGDYWDHKWNISAWAKYDRIVQMAVERGLQLIVRLDNPPAWSRARGDALGTLAPPDRVEDYGDFVETVVRRYRGKVRYYQIWNEPNIYPEWGEQDVDAAAYTRLLQEAYRRAKAADPDCVIVSAGLAPTLETGGRNLSDLVYLQQMYDAGARGYFDVLGVMAYGLWTGPTDHRIGADRTNFSRPELIRAIMVRNGDADKPIWAMEIGWNALPPDHAAQPVYGRVTREQQARYAVEAYARAQREWPWMGVMNYWFFRRPTDTEKHQPFYYFNLLEPDFTPQPAYTSLREFLSGQRVVYPGYHQEDHWALSYGGSWQDVDDGQAVLGRYRRSGAGARLSFTFWGADLDLVTFGPADPSALKATIDGRPARLAAGQVGGRPTLKLARGLPLATHTVEIELSGDQSGFAIDGLIVSRAPSYGVQVIAGLAVVATAGATGAAVALRRVRSRRRSADADRQANP